MPENLQKHSKLLVVSDTGMYQEKGKIYAFGPVVLELLEMLSLFKTITWIGFNREDQKRNDSYIEVKSTEIKIILLKRVGGSSIIDKLKILSYYPKMRSIINSEIKQHQYIHNRAPSNPAYISMLLSSKYPKKRFWFKYAGDWKGKASYFYNLQRNKLRKLKSNSIVTVNGSWKNQSKNIIAFENPCLTEEDRSKGQAIIKNKKRTGKINYCFVGGLNTNKGIDKILDAFKTIKTVDIGTFHIVGDGVLRNSIEKKIKELSFNCIVHGSLPKEQVVEIYKQSHFIILPSESEGFPKVIGEAMNYGCVPIVSDVSCIGQYVIEGINGFLINPITVDEIKKTIERSLNISDKSFEMYLNKNYKRATIFTYDYYLDQIQNKIIKNN